MSDLLRWVLRWFNRPSPIKYTTALQITNVQAVIDIIPGDPEA